MSESDKIDSKPFPSFFFYIITMCEIVSFGDEIFSCANEFPEVIYIYSVFFFCWKSTICYLVVT